MSALPKSVSEPSSTSGGAQLCPCTLSGASGLPATQEWPFNVSVLSRSLPGPSTTFGGAQLCICTLGECPRPFCTSGGAHQRVCTPKECFRAFLYLRRGPTSSLHSQGCLIPSCTSRVTYQRVSSTSGGDQLPTCTLRECLRPSCTSGVAQLCPCTLRGASGLLAPQECTVKKYFLTLEKDHAFILIQYCFNCNNTPVHL